jgi:hypothetical protein
MLEMFLNVVSITLHLLMLLFFPVFWSVVKLTFLAKEASDRLQVEILYCQSKRKARHRLPRGGR